jgi:hypothetical protein
MLYDVNLRILEKKVISVTVTKGSGKNFVHSTRESRLENRKKKRIHLVG